MYYTMDALLASLLLMSLAVLVINNPFQDTGVEQKSFLSNDLLNSLSNLKVGELDHPFIEQEILNGNITDTNLSILDQIGVFWAENKTGKASSLFHAATHSILPEKIGVRLSIQGQEIHTKDYDNKKNVVTGTRFLSGVTEGEPLAGYSSSAFLKRIRNKKTSSYAFFGGFVGQGNITFFIDDIPGDVNETRIVGIHLEGDYASNFEFYINSELCEQSPGSPLFTPDTASMVVNTWSLEHCKTSINPGRNDFSINFTSGLTNSYVAGGLLKIDYRTDELQQSISFGEDQYYFPGIYGLANLYDSFYIPGTLETMNIALHFESGIGTQTYITIGERIITLNTSEGGEQQVHLSNEELLNTYNLDYEQLSRNTIPLRFASYNATTQILTGGNADVILITDFSRSMMRAVANWNMGNLGAKCDQVFEDPETRRTNMAKCVDNEFVDTVMNFTGNRIWPVFIHQDRIKYYDNPDDAEAIKGYINSYPNGLGLICMSCAINQAYELLEEYSSDNRSKFIVVMTNGVPTHCGDDGCSGTSTTFGGQQCTGLCTQPGNCPASTVESQCTDCTNNPGAAQNAIIAAQRAANNLNATIFTIGFGPVDDCDQAGDMLTQIAEIGNGTYQHSSDIEELRMIYQNISMEILERLEQENQTVIVDQEITGSKLFGDSHINFTYDPIVSGVSPGKISVNVYEPLHNCDETINIPRGLEIVDAKVISYSGMHWSDLVVANNVTVFNMSDYYVPYYRLGDPLAIQVPVDIIQEGNNTLFVETGESPENRTGCSPHNSFIYTAMIPAVTSRTDVTEKIEGCTWTVAYEDGTYDEIKVPAGYDGGKACSYRPGNISYDNTDTYDLAVYSLLRQLDLANSSRVFVNINQLDLEIVTTVIGEVPYLWGPSQVKIEVWQ